MPNDVTKVKQVLQRGDGQDGGNFTSVSRNVVITIVERRIMECV